MTEIRFYHLQNQPLEQALPAILTKALEKGHRIIVRLPDEAEVERLNQHLWVYRPDSFIPHGSKKDGHAEDQPVWLTAKDENPNRADVLIVCGTASAAPDNYSLCCEMLDGNNAVSITAARDRWKTYTAAGHNVTYWQQSEQGGWEKKAG